MIEKIISIRPGNFCPNCKEGLEVNESPDNPLAIPEPGDVNVCGYCSSVLVYNDDLSIRNPTAEEIAEFKADAEFWNQIQKNRWLVKEMF